MTTCRDSRCEQELVWIDGIAYSKHYEPSHYSRINRGKPKTDELGFTGKETSAQVAAKLKAHAQELERRGV